VSAHVAGHSLKAAAELVDLNGDAGEGRGVAPFRSVLVDERAEISAAIQRRAADGGLRSDRAADNPVNYTDLTGAAPWDLISSVKWFHENGGPDAGNKCVKNALQVNPSQLARLLFVPFGPTEDPIGWLAVNDAALKVAWSETVQKADSKAGTGTMPSQFVCHWWLVREIPGRAFHLETWRPDRGIVGDIAARCNPV
jgi:hypothetical protein